MKVTVPLCRRVLFAGWFTRTEKSAGTSKTATKIGHFALAK
jgi:hypothetical protein